MHNFCSRLTMATNYLTLLPLRSVVHVLFPWIFADTAFWSVECEEVTVPNSEPKNSKIGHFNFLSLGTHALRAITTEYEIQLAQDHFHFSIMKPTLLCGETMWKEKFSACSQFSHYHHLGSDTCVKKSSWHTVSRLFQS